MLYSLSRDGLLRRWNLEAPRPGDPLAIQGRCNSDSFDIVLDLNSQGGGLILASQGEGKVIAVDMSQAPRIVTSDLPGTAGSPLPRSPFYSYGLSPHGLYFFIQSGYGGEPTMFGYMRNRRPASALH